MAVLLETSLGDLTIDLYTDERPICCKNFLKLCKIKYYNFSLFHSVQRNLVAQTGDPTETGRGGESIFMKLYGEQARYFEQEVKPRIKHSKRGTVSMVNNGNNMHGSQFFVTLAEDLDYLNGEHTVFGEVGEGFDVLDKLNEAYCDKEHRPYRDIRIFHTVVIDDPFDDPDGLAEHIPDRSPEPTKKQLQSSRIGVDEDIDDFKGKTHEEIEEILQEREAKANAQILEMVGDIPDVDVKPPDNVLFVCKLNPVTSDEDLEVIFSRFGTIESCEVIRDQKSGESLQYAFVEFEKPEDCENAYFKMDNVLIDDRRIHVDFSQSVSKVRWKGKGKGVIHQKEEKEERKPDYIIKDRSKKEHYDLVYSDHEDSDHQAGHKQKKKKKKTRHSDSESEGDRKKIKSDKHRVDDSGDNYKNKQKKKKYGYLDDEEDYYRKKKRSGSSERRREETKKEHSRRERSRSRSHDRHYSKHSDKRGSDRDRRDHNRDKRDHRSDRDTYRRRDEKKKNKDRYRDRS